MAEKSTSDGKAVSPFSYATPEPTMEADPRFPTANEQGLLAADIVITKVKHNPTNIQPTYHKWHNVWADAKTFRVSGANPDFTFRAIAVTLPMYFLDDPKVIEFTYRGYVAGIRFEPGSTADVQLFPSGEVVWV